MQQINEFTNYIGATTFQYYLKFHKVSFTTKERRQLCTFDKCIIKDGVTWAEVK